MILHRFKVHIWRAKRLFSKVGKDFLSAYNDAETEEDIMVIMV